MDLNQMARDCYRLEAQIQDKQLTNRQAISQFCSRWGFQESEYWEEFPGHADIWLALGFYAALEFSELAVTEAILSNG